MPPQVPALHQTIVVVDVAGFTDRDRTTVHQRAVHEGLYTVLRAAFAEAGVDWGACAVEDRGDGALILVSPEVAKSRLADQLPGRLITGLRRYNAVHSAEAVFKLRVGLHAGEVYHDEYGVGSHAVNHAFRILEASEAKSALKLSTGMLALIASDAFYHDVIAQDPATDPGSYRRIPVSVKETSTVAWLRLPDGAVPAGVLDWLPATEGQRLRKQLDGLTVSQLPTLVHRAAGPGVAPAPSGASAWEAFSYLADFNAGADGFPPALMFVELVALQVGGEVGASLMEWNNDQARRLRLEPELRAERADGASRVPTDSRLHLLIVAQPDGIDPDRYLLSHWRQDDPAEWPPAPGGTRMVTFDELEQCAYDLVVSAERAWSGRADAVTLEFVFPPTLLDRPVHLWHKEHDSGDPRPLSLIVMHSLERIRSSQWNQVWHQRWQTVMNDPSATRVHSGLPADAGERHRIDAVLSAPRWVAAAEGQLQEGAAWVRTRDTLRAPGGDPPPGQAPGTATSSASAVGAIEVREAVVEALVEAGLAEDAQSRSLLIQVISDYLAHPLRLPEHLVGGDHLIELVNACAKTEGGMMALAWAVGVMRPGSPECDRISRFVKEPRVLDLGSSGPRQVNAWLAEPEGRWREGELTAVLFDIGPRRSAAVVSGHFVEPPPPVNDDGQWLYILLVADAGSVRPVGAPLWLPAEGPTAVLRFEVTPARPGPLVLCFRVFLQQGSLLLQELTATVTVAGQPIATRLEQQ